MLEVQWTIPPRSHPDRHISPNDQAVAIRWWYRIVLNLLISSILQGHTLRISLSPPPQHRTKLRARPTQSKNKIRDPRRSNFWNIMWIGTISMRLLSRTWRRGRSDARKYLRKTDSPIPGRYSCGRQISETWRNISTDKIPTGQRRSFGQKGH